MSVVCVSLLVGTCLHVIQAGHMDQKGTYVESEVLYSVWVSS